MSMNHRDNFNQICKLTKFASADMLAVLKPYYSEKHRHFHTLDHVLDILWQIEQLNSDGGFSSELEYKSFQCAALFHDVVYNPRSNKNEDNSESFFKAHANEYHGIDVELVIDLIIGTSLVNDSEARREVKIFNNIDRSILVRDFDSLVEYGEKIWKEYSFHDYSKFLDGHFKLIRELLDNYGYDNHEDIKKYENYMRNKKLKVGLYAGSFNPFHIGHLDVLEQAKAFFDKIIVCRGVNPEKIQTDAAYNNKRIEDVTIKGVPGIFQQTEFNAILLSRYVEILENSENYDVSIIRGFRDEKDIASEITQRKYSLESKKNLKYVFFASSPGLEHVSSSAIRTLTKFNEDVSKYLPKETV